MRRVGGTLLHKNSQYIRGRVQCEQASLHPWVPQTRTGDAVFRGRRDQTQHIGTDSSYRLDGIQRCEIFVPGMAVLDTCRGATLSTVPFLEATETKSAEFSAKRTSPDPQEDKEEDYYANMGDAIRTLREDIPQLFRKEFDYSIYREDIVFKDSRLEFRGIKNYKIILWSLRFHGQLFFKHMHVDILRIWQPEEYIIKMRWQVNGYPRVWWEAEGRIDGISTYKLDKKGKIYEHTVDNVQLRDPPIENPLLYGLNYVLSPSKHPQSIPMPGS
ncbi:hypothetical protein PSENEW3_00002613 [Picochlorum sp. SENEW3]|nr:hypothetical protein PSENEW3_00002613 [Picochlorum sp. SENEW3]